jgi:Transposase DDE domain
MGCGAGWLNEGSTYFALRGGPTVMTMTGRSALRVQASSPKQRFNYDAERDVYHCPAGRELIFFYQENDALGRYYREYWGRQCDGCPLRSQCTDSPRGRKLKRYDGEEFREQMASILRHPLARARYRRRQVIVEPCFAELRERQGLKRFRRRGLKAVRVEFALHCIAFNLKRATAEHLLLLIFYILLQNDFLQRR